jgi:hypothetical protein
MTRIVRGRIGEGIFKFGLIWRLFNKVTFECDYCIYVAEVLKKCLQNLYLIDYMLTYSDFFLFI